MYKVGRMTEEGTWEVLVECETYDQADHACDVWEHKYPHAWVDILEDTTDLNYVYVESPKITQILFGG